MTKRGCERLLPTSSNTTSHCWSLTSLQPPEHCQDRRQSRRYLGGISPRPCHAPNCGSARWRSQDRCTGYRHLLTEAARSMPHTLSSLHLDDEQLAELTMQCGFDDDLADQITQTSDRIRGLPAQIHPALERVLGPRLDHPAVLDLLQRHPPPTKRALRTN